MSKRLKKYNSPEQKQEAIQDCLAGKGSLRPVFGAQDIFYIDAERSKLSIYFSFRQV